MLASSESKAKEAVGKLLNDPYSAQYTEIGKGASSDYVCGYVNAKNKMGAYTGRTPFYYSKAMNMAFIASSPSDAEFRQLWRDLKNKNSDDQYLPMGLRCHAAAEYSKVCNKPEVWRHSMCAKIEDGEALYLAMHAAYGD